MPSRIQTNRSEPGSTVFGVVQSKPDTDTSVVSVEGELDLITAPSLKWALVDALESGSSRLIVDLTLTTFIDSTALSVLVGVTRRQENDPRLAIACAQPNVLRIFEFSGLDGAFAIFPTLDEALTYIRGQEAWAS